MPAKKSLTYPQLGSVSSQSVEKHTKRSWDEWVELLDKDGCRTDSWKEIVERLRKKYRLTPWWQQGVAIGYEIAIGRRLPGQNSKGYYTVTATKSFPVSAITLWNFVTSEKGMKLWLRPLFKFTLEPGASFETDDGYFGEVRTLLKNKRFRMHWRDPDWDKASFVQVHLLSRPKGKSMLVVDHGQLKDLRIKARLKNRWREAVDQMADALRPASRP